MKTLSLPQNARPSPVYNEQECNYMKALIEKIVMSDTHTVTMISAVQLTSTSTQLTQSQSTSKKVTKQRAEELIEEWTAAGYFMALNDMVTLGPRGIGEFRETFRTKFTDYIQCCQLCSEIALQVNDVWIFENFYELFFII